jgi:hypothetical protein
MIDQLLSTQIDVSSSVHPTEVCHLQGVYNFVIHNQVMVASLCVKTEYSRFLDLGAESGVAMILIQVNHLQQHQWGKLL